MRVFFFTRRQALFLALLIATGIGILVGSYKAMPAAVPVDAQPYYKGDGTELKISLAINVDWGEEYIEDILKVLAENGAKATFFLTGRWTEHNPDLAFKIKEAGHELGNHAYSHKSPNKLSYEENRQEITRTAQAIKAATGIETKLYAPPSGEKNAHVLKAAADLGYSTILWSLDTIDWKRPPADSIIKKIVAKAGGGDIILAHPTHPTLEALPTILKELKAKGFVFVTVSQNLGLEALKASAPINDNPKPEPKEQSLTDNDEFVELLEGDD